MISERLKNQNLESRKTVKLKNLEFPLKSRDKSKGSIN